MLDPSGVEGMRCMRLFKKRGKSMEKILVPSVDMCGVIGYIVNETKSQAFSENNYELLMFVRMFVLKEK